ncbi:DNA-directed RNA polymerase [Baffinella frigidus]|nr:DNA-directed RNA polymerase [Cryptophyta sp. CCMP2293]|mmetsp:Transcript_42450/g.100959  ORF Transcript_42450/g.100959 Transcript_42450/m.100959 type:complete len:124 (+) Transcript_42450:114-485(+)|eukprot:CAMPEP_0180147608 /NCGR_PEP_ID=MMETSP0986-20121125/19388_1 /TAXON_ID=697907 /ORGANISM="non described non described, Strain CCMP2293" /LENGTH=123 /DNA_ID=CAMNT_0022093251 /DNA_START=101 /DNA_END=472 /DNA_ORIENTATION=-
MNAPKIEETVFLLPEEEKVTIEEDTKIEGAANFTLIKEDHTIGNPLRVALLRDPSVLFAGYRLPHPLINKMQLKIQTKSTSNPQLALTDAITALKKELKMLDEKFDEAVTLFKENQSSGAGAY